VVVLKLEMRQEVVTELCRFACEIIDIGESERVRGSQCSHVITAGITFTRQDVACLDLSNFGLASSAKSERRAR
jgi:hypothetical protein